MISQSERKKGGFGTNEVILRSSQPSILRSSKPHLINESGRNESNATDNSGALNNRENINERRPNPQMEKLSHSQFSHHHHFSPSHLAVGILTLALVCADD